MIRNTWKIKNEINLMPANSAEIKRTPKEENISANAERNKNRIIKFLNPNGVNVIKCVSATKKIPIAAKCGTATSTIPASDLGLIINSSFPL